MQDQYSPLASGLLDTIGSTRGSVLYRGSGGWFALSPGTSGHFLKSNGSGADPSYAAAGGGSFDPAAATSLTFVSGQATITNGAAGDTVYVRGKDGASADAAGDPVLVIGGAGDGLGAGAGVELRGGYSGDSDDGARVAVGGAQKEGQGASVTLTARSSLGTSNSDGGSVSAVLGDKDGSGTAGSFRVENASSATLFKVSYLGVLTMTSNSTGAGTPLLGTNCPASTLTAPYTWVKITTSDGSTAYLPAWK